MTNRTLGIVVFVFAVIYTLATLNLSRAPVGNPMAPLYFPLGLGLATSAVGLLLLFSSRASQEKQKSDDRGSKLRRYMPLFLTVIACFLYAFCFRKLGFLTSTILFMIFLLSLTNGFKRWPINLLVTVIYTLGTWLLFERVFMINLP